MRSIKTVRQPAPAPLNEEERSQHIRAAYASLNSILLTASRHDASFAFLQGARYVLTLNEDSAVRGMGTLLDRRENRSYEIKICFGSSVSDVQLRREFFEDINDFDVRVKQLSQPSLFRNFLEFLKNMQSSDSMSYRTFGTTSNHRIAAVA